MKNNLLIIILFFISNSIFSQTELDMSSFRLTGNAKQVGEECFRLTEAVEWQGGAVWYKTPIDLSNSFEVEMDLMFGVEDYGADGFVFIFHPKLTKGFAGEGMGFGGLKPSLGIEMDTYENHHLYDPPFDHIAVMKNGSVRHSNNLSKPVRLHESNENVEDGSRHRVKIIWNPDSKNLKVYFDGSRRINLNSNIVKDFFGGNSIVYWGFSAATGGMFNKQEVCLEKLDFTTAPVFDAATKKELLAGKNYTLKDVNFTSGRSELKEISYKELNKLIRLLNDNKDLNIYIGGHTDSVGNASNNQQLSKRRALAVKNYLMEKGIDKNRIKSKGYGELFPKGNNNTAKGREENRRVEVYLIKPRA